VVQYKVIVQKEMERMCCNDYGKANANDSDNEQGLDIQVLCLIVMIKYLWMSCYMAFSLTANRHW